MKLLANLDRQLVPATREAERYLRVQIVAPDRPGTGDRLPLNLALIIDRSGSMAGSKLEKAKEAAIYCLRNLTGADRAAVVTYDDQVVVTSPSRALTPAVKNQLITEIRGIFPGGSTNLGGGWLTGAQEVANHLHEANYLSRTILLSDGLANVGIVDPDELAHHASELRERGVSTTTMGIGADFNEELLERMAIKGGGHFYFIEDARQIPDFLRRELGEVLSTSARRVSLQMDVPEGVRATLLNNFEVTRTGKHFDARLDDMISGEVRSLVFKLNVRPGTKGAGGKLPVSLVLSYLDVDSGETITLRSDEIVLTYSSDAQCDAEVPDAAVGEEAALLEAALAREEALKYDREGHYAMSQSRLAQAAAYMRTAAPASPAVMAEADALEAESTEASQGFAEMRRKAIHYDQMARRQSRQK